MPSLLSTNETPQDILGQYTACIDKLDRMERAALSVYRPSLKQEAFHLSKAQQKIIRGGRQSGKSICASAEFASRITGLPIIGRDGKPLNTGWRPPSKEHPYTAWVIGWDEDHIGQTIHRLLFQEGARNSVRVIRDQKTSEYRIWSFADPADKVLEDQSQLAGPMIPEEMIDHWAWDSSAQKVFEACYLTNGAVIYAFPSSARHPKQGEAVDLIWIDEDIQHPDHYIEWRYRLGLRSGSILWSVWPHQENTALLDLLDAAEEQRGSENASVEEFQLISSENEWIPQDQRRLMLTELRDEEQIRRHDRGEIVMNRLYMYDFSRDIHLLRKRKPGEIPQPPKTPRDVLETIYSNGSKFPRSWTRYLAIDPSHQRTAVLSFVVTPEMFMDVEIGHRVVVEWDVIAQRAKASDLCKQLKPLMEGYDYEAFVMDQNKGRQTNTGEGRTTFQVYEDAFEEIGLKSRRTKYGFYKGCNIPTKRQNTVREWLAASWGGLPQLLFCDQHTAACQWEVYRYMKKQMSDGTIIDEAANPRKFDAMAALEYGVEFLRTPIESGTAFQVYRPDFTQTPDWAKKVLDDTEPNKRRGQQIHLGPGLAA